MRAKFSLYTCICQPYQLAWGRNFPCIQYLSALSTCMRAKFSLYTCICQPYQLAWGRNFPCIHVSVSLINLHEGEIFPVYMYLSALSTCMRAKFSLYTVSVSLINLHKNPLPWWWRVWHHRMATSWPLPERHGYNPGWTGLEATSISPTTALSQTWKQNNECLWNTNALAWMSISNNRISITRNVYGTPMP